MNAEGIREIAKMQNKIDCYEYFLSNLFLKLANPNRDIGCVETSDDVCEGLWLKVEELQNQIKEHERKASYKD